MGDLRRIDQKGSGARHLRLTSQLLSIRRHVVIRPRETTTRQLDGSSGFGPQEYVRNIRSQHTVLFLVQGTTVEVYVPLEKFRDDCLIASDLIVDLYYSGLLFVTSFFVLTKILFIFQIQRVTRDVRPSRVMSTFG